jgi:hypothetical protein
MLRKLGGSPDASPPSQLALCDEYTVDAVGRAG